jgi:hypothetical protein
MKAGKAALVDRISEPFHGSFRPLRIGLTNFEII